MYLANFCTDGLRCNAITHFPTGYVIGLAEGRDRDSALAQLAVTQNAGVSFRCKADVFIDFIAQHVDFVVRNRLPQLLEIALTPHGGRRIVWRVEDHQTSTGA